MLSTEEKERYHAWSISLLKLITLCEKQRLLETVEVGKALYLYAERQIRLAADVDCTGMYTIMVRERVRREVLLARTMAREHRDKSRAW